VACIAIASIIGCKKDSKTSSTQMDAISSETLAKIQHLGFSTKAVQKVEEGYMVEGDIVLTDELLNSSPQSTLLRIGNEEQYRTTNLVTRLPRTITILVSNLGTAFVQGADIAISRYNALNGQIKFSRITSGTPNITILGFNQGPSGGYITLGSSGFPTSSGNPYKQIKMNTNQYAYGSNPDVNYVGSVIQHEIGHCIGFRHTDYMDRSYSCGGTPTNEGASNVGVILIPGTPSGPDANSWMLACSNGGNRTFNANDVTAMHYLYH
ncbi:MAG TPA: M57 family metalloprotease, partial [Flavisolibacter sp.]|nr:M57 family metalloprotease [Flavisolibacter sp.]